jgi:hypothetical protein
MTNKPFDARVDYQNQWNDDIKMHDSKKIAKWHEKLNLSQTFKKTCVGETNLQTIRFLRSSTLKASSILNNKTFSTL